MTKREVESALKELDDYFRIHSWCTQMDEKISAFISVLDERSYAYVKEWALNTLGKKNLKSNSQILAIIFLKLCGVDDKELIRLLYAVLSDRLTYEDFKSLNGYIFKGKPPLSPDLFYNITERVFIDKKSALKKALSISSIISEADPELTIFYMTMLLCRVDLNSENKAMLNLLLYCVDADIPDEMAEGIRDNLSELSDILNELLNDSEEEKGGEKDVLEKVFHHLSEKKKNPAIITIEQRPAEREFAADQVPEVFESGKMSDTASVISSRSTDVSAPEDNQLEKDEERKAVDRVPEDAGMGKVSGEGESTPVSRNFEEQKTVAGGDRSSGADRDGFRKKTSLSNPGGKAAAEEKDKSGQEPAVRSKTDISAFDGSGLQGDTDNGESGKEIISGGSALSYSRKEEERKAVEKPVPKKYRIGLRKFGLGDLRKIAGRKTGKNPEKIKSVSAKDIPGSADSEKKQRKQRKRSCLRRCIAGAAVVVSGFLLYAVLNEDKSEASDSAIQAGAVRAAPAGEGPVTAETPLRKESKEKKVPEKIPETAADEYRENSGQQVSALFDIRQTPRGLEWTVKKGESVWKLYMYLKNNSAELKGELAELARMDWLPFIHQVIRLNPWKSFAQPIEPGEKFIIR